MIISDRYRFAFVHIPKCAGTLVRNRIKDLDDCEGRFTRRVEQHEELGLIDYVHLPLFTLRDYFPDEFAKVQEYWAFALIRDPFERFPSSVAQRFKMYGGGAIENQSRRQIKGEIDQVIQFLLNTPRQAYHLPADYIHFQRQVDFVELEGRQVVSALYCIGEVDALMQEVNARIGRHSRDVLDNVGRRQVNRSVVYRNEVIRLLATSRPLLRRAYRSLPLRVRKRLRSILYVPSNRRLNSLFSSDYVKGFIESYYGEDLRLYTEMRDVRLLGGGTIA